MPLFTDLTGLAGVASAAAAASLLLPRVERLGKLHLAMMLGAIFALMLIPFGGMPLAAYVRGMTGDLSMTTLVLLWCGLLRLRTSAHQDDNRFALLILIALTAIALYPLALGVGVYDPYRLGYGSHLLVVVLLLIALLAWYRGFSLIAVCIALAMLAWSVGWYESDNLWDYLVDPFAAVYALAAIMTRGVKAVFRSR